MTMPTKSNNALERRASAGGLGKSHDVDRSRTPTPNFKVSTKPGAVGIELDRADTLADKQALLRAVGSEDFDFLSGLLTQIAAAGMPVQVEAKGPNFILATIKGAAPADQIESMLAAQMAAVHMATMKFAGRLGAATSELEREAVGRTFSRLARTFAAQVEAFKRYRTGGGQTVTVQHVTVNEGGQAIVGEVSSDGNGNRRG